MKRKTFLKRTAASLVAGITGGIALQHCSSDDDAAPPVKSCLDHGAKPLSISSNHGHTLVVSKDDVVSGATKSYNILGTANHGHSVTITDSDFIRLRNNEQIALKSTNDNGHEHNITVVCSS